MKKLIIYTSLSIFILSGCAKKLEVLPTQSIDETEVFTSDANIKAALNGAYDAASSGSVLGGDMQMYSELLGSDDEVRWAGTFNDPREIWRKAIPTNNDYVRFTWTESYKAINICNNILNAIDIVNEDDRDRVKGEALFLRGTIYFGLVELYAKPYSTGNAASSPGLQIVTTPTVGNITDANFVPRSTVQATYDQIISDLTTAKGLLPAENGVYANTFAASAILSRVYLQMADYAKARDEATSIIDSPDSPYFLESSYANAFNNSSNSSEDIFAIQVSDKDGANDMHLHWSIPEFGARDGDVDIEETHLDLYYDSDDTRLALFYLDDQGIYRSGKWKLQFKNIPIVRLAEMYLTRAEALVRLGAPGDGDADLKMITDRAQIDPIAGATIADILLQRRLELAHEGQRVQDIKRLKGSADGFEWDANEMVFPIPLREINASKGALTQNDGY